MSEIKLPIDVVDPRPGVRGKTFRWSYTTDGPTGRRVIPCEGSVQPSMEAAVTDLIALTKRLDARLNGKDGMMEVAAKLQAFKEWVHAYLDGKGVPVAPPGTHGAEGCRIGDRMDHVFAELEMLRERVGCVVEDAKSEAAATDERYRVPDDQVQAALPPNQAKRGRR